jgi:hypothetical protein
MTVDAAGGEALDGTKEKSIVRHSRVLDLDTFCSPHGQCLPQKSLPKISVVSVRRQPVPRENISRSLTDTICPVRDQF